MMSVEQIRHARKVATQTARASMKQHIKEMPLPELTATSEADFEAHAETFKAGARAMRHQILQWDYDSGPSLKDVLRDL